MVDSLGAWMNDGNGKDSTMVEREQQNWRFIVVWGALVTLGEP